MNKLLILAAAALLLCGCGHRDDKPRTMMACSPVEAFEYDNVDLVTIDANGAWVMHCTDGYTRFSTQPQLSVASRPHQHLIVTTDDSLPVVYGVVYSFEQHIDGGWQLQGPDKDGDGDGDVTVGHGPVQIVVDPRKP